MNTIEVTVDELSEYTEALARDIMKSHEKKFVEAIRKVQDAGQNIQTAGDRLTLGVKNAWGTLDKLASGYGIRLAETIKEEGKTLSTATPGKNYEAVEQFHQNAMEVTNRIINAVRKYVPRLHRALKPEMNTLNTALTKLESSVKSLGMALDESPGSQIQFIQRQAHNLAERSGELLVLRTEREKNSQQLMEVESSERRLISKRAELISRPEFLELHRLEDSLRAKEEEINQFLQPLVKPLVKLDRVLSNTDIAQVNAIHGIIEHPVETIVTGQRFLLLQLLDTLQEYMRLGKIEIEDRKRRKAEEIILVAKDGMIDGLKEEYLAIQANLSETVRQLKRNSLMQHLEGLDSLTAETAQTKKMMLEKQHDLQRRIEQVSQSIAKMKKDIESAVSKIASRKIAISPP